MTDVKIENLSNIPTASTLLKCRKEFAKNNRKCQFLFDKILAEIGLKKAIDNCTPDKAQKVLDMYKQEHTISNIITTLDLNKEIPEEEKPKLPSYKQYLRAAREVHAPPINSEKVAVIFVLNVIFAKANI